MLGATNRSDREFGLFEAQDVGCDLSVRAQTPHPTIISGSGASTKSSSKLSHQHYELIGKHPASQLQTIAPSIIP